MTESALAGQSPAMPTASALGSSSHSEFERLFSENYAFVWRSLVHFGLTAASADDAAQEVFLVVHRRLSEFDPTRSFKSWVYGIARRAARAHERGHRRSVERDTRADEPTAAEAPDEQLEARQTAALVKACLDAMPEEQREVFVLADMEDLTAPEISLALGVKLNTVYSRLRLARERFETEHARFVERGGVS